MWVFRILFLLVLISICSSAQSSPDKSSVSPQFEIRTLAAPPELRREPVVLRSDGQNRIGAVPFERLVQPSPSQPEQIEVIPFRPEPTAICYSIQTYRVTRHDPQSDVTTPADYSECQPGNRYAFKAAVDSPAFR